MKKRLALLLAVLLLMAALPALSQAEEVLQGIITETKDGQFLLYDDTHGDVWVNYDESTPMDGLAVPRAGQYIAVVYSGVMTRSLPPQVTAESVQRFLLDGTALAYDPKTHTQLILTPDAGLVLASLPESAEPYAPGDFITVSYNGLTDQPAPGHINVYRADRLESTQGVITAMEDGWLTLGDGDSAVRARYDGNTRLYGALTIGGTAVVYSSGVTALSLPP